MHSSQPYPLSPPFFFSHVLFQLSNYYPYLLLFLLYHFFAHFLVRFSSLCIFPLPFAFPFINFSTSINFFLPFNPINLVISLSLLKMFPTILFFMVRIFVFLNIYTSLYLSHSPTISFFSLFQFPFVLYYLPQSLNLIPLTRFTYFGTLFPPFPIYPLYTFSSSLL